MIAASGMAFRLAAARPEPVPPTRVFGAGSADQSVDDGF